MTMRPAHTPPVLAPPPLTGTALVGTGATADRAPSADGYPFEPGSLISAANATALFDRYPAYADTLRWLDDEITQPDERIGRRGARCPRVRPALRADTLWLVTIRTNTGQFAEAVAKGSYLAGLFTELAGAPAAAGDGCLLALFPDVEPDHAGQFIDGGHAALRMQFVAAGLMLGEFHPRSTVGAVRNPQLPVMRSPWPMFVVRALTVHDLMFLDQPRTPPAERLQYFDHYRRHLQDRLDPEQRRRLAAAISAAQADR
jgi:hypothetical protein